MKVLFTALVFLCGHVWNFRWSFVNGVIGRWTCSGLLPGRARAFPFGSTFIFNSCSSQFTIFIWCLCQLCSQLSSVSDSTDFNPFFAFLLSEIFGCFLVAPHFLSAPPPSFSLIACLSANREATASLHAVNRSASERVRGRAGQDSWYGSTSETRPNKASPVCTALPWSVSSTTSTAAAAPAHSQALHFISSRVFLSGFISVGECGSFETPAPSHPPTRPSVHPLAVSESCPVYAANFPHPFANLGVLNQGLWGKSQT